MSGRAQTGGISVERRGDVVEVAGALTIATAREAMLAALPWFASDAALLRFDLAKLQRTDSAGLAVLLEWLRRARRTGKSVEYVGVPKRLRQLAAICELEEVLGLRKQEPVLSPA